MPDHVLALPALDDTGRYFAGCRTCGAILRAPTLPELVPLIGSHLGAQPVIVTRERAEDDAIADAEARAWHEGELVELEEVGDEPDESL